MATTRIYLVRHGQSAGNAEGRFGGHGPTPLSALGREQAVRVGKMLAKDGVSLIYSSDLMRAVQTAEPLSELINQPIIKTPAFRERHVGVLEGLTFSESKEQFPQDYFALVNRNINHVIRGGESYRQLLRRSSNCFWDIVRSNPGKSIAIFSHTGAICFLTLNLMGAINRSTKQTPWLVTSNCGVNRIEIRGRHNIRLLAVNDTRHLMDTTGNDSFAAL